MTWFKIDDGFYDHPKVKSIPKRQRPTAIMLWTFAGSWCANHLTDGLVPEYMVDELGSLPRDAAALVTSGLWDVIPGGYCFHDWHEYQPTRDQVEKERSDARERMRRRRNGPPEKPNVRDMFGRTTTEGA